MSMDFPKKYVKSYFLYIAQKNTARTGVLPTLTVKNTELFGFVNLAKCFFELNSE